MSTITKRFALSAALVFGTIGSASHAQVAGATAGDFVGMWKLESRTQRLADGTTRQPPVSVGYLVYTDTSQMCYVAMNPNRPKWKEPTTPTSDEALSGIMGLGAYCAGVEIHKQEGFVVHHIEIERSPNLVNTGRKRWFAFVGPDRLVLKIDTPELSLPVVEDTLTWGRVLKSQ